MLHIAYFIIVSGHNIRNFSIFDLYRVENCLSRSCKHQMPLNYVQTAAISKLGQNSHVTPAFSGVPNAKRREKIRIGCLTPGFSGAQKLAE